jgi:membrane-bound lytic murein transglycosylase A
MINQSTTTSFPIDAGRHVAAARVRARSAICCMALGMLTACQTAPPPARPPVSAPSVSAPGPVIAPPPAPRVIAPTRPLSARLLRETSFERVPGWTEDQPQLAWSALLTSCSVLRAQSAWQNVCATAAALSAPARENVRRYFETEFKPYQVVAEDGGETGLVTGYYEPLLRGSRVRTAVYRYPLYGVPDDLLLVDFADLYPQVKDLRLRGRIDGRRVVPYYSRGQISQGALQSRAQEIVWVDDEIELFFLHIQGSGRVRLDNGETVIVGFAEQNGHPYRSIGKLLVDRGDLPLERASMQGIKSWASQNPDKLQELLNYNPSYVFFRELPGDLSGPLGALGVPLTAGRSVAVDARYVPLGAPIFLATTMPNSREPLNRLLLAQDTGGAIRGPVRADFFWGFGEEAAALAGRMRQTARMWVLLPNGYPLTN